MQRLRSTWLALMGGALLVTLSVSAAFGAPPDPDAGPRGQTVAAFVHELVFGADEETDEELAEADEADEEQLEEDEADEADEADEEQLEDTADTAQLEEGETHGECVSEAAHNWESYDTDAMNHGEWVSDHARYICRDLELRTEDTEETSAEVVADTVELSAQEARKADQAAAKAERDAARAAAKAAARGERDAAKAARTGNGRGGGKP